MKEKTTNETQRALSFWQGKWRRHSIRHSRRSKAKCDSQTLQIIEHRLHRLIPVRNLLCHCVVNNRGQIRWKTCVYLYCWLVCFVQDCVHHIDAALGLERKPAS